MLKARFFPPSFLLLAVAGLHYNLLYSDSLSGSSEVTSSAKGHASYELATEIAKVTSKLNVIPDDECFGALAAVVYFFSCVLMRRAGV